MSTYFNKSVDATDDDHDSSLSRLGSIDSKEYDLNRRSDGIIDICESFSRQSFESHTSDTKSPKSECTSTSKNVGEIGVSQEFRGEYPPPAHIHNNNNNQQQQRPHSFTAERMFGDTSQSQSNRPSSYPPVYPARGTVTPHQEQYQQPPQPYQQLPQPYQQPPQQQQPPPKPPRSLYDQSRVSRSLEYRPYMQQQPSPPAMSSVDIDSDDVFAQLPSEYNGPGGERDMDELYPPSMVRGGQQVGRLGKGMQVRMGSSQYLRGRQTLPPPHPGNNNLPVSAAWDGSLDDNGSTNSGAGGAPLYPPPMGSSPLQSHYSQTRNSPSIGGGGGSATYGVQSPSNMSTHSSRSSSPSPDPGPSYNDGGSGGAPFFGHGHSPDAYGSQPQQMQFSPPDGMQQTVYQVQFKNAFRYFVLLPTANPASIKVGDFVKVEADRGEDLGVVTSLMPMREFIDLRVQHRISVSIDDDSGSIRHILRPATMHERQNLVNKVQDEQNVLNLCQQLVACTYKLPMSVVDAEYQFDRHKLTISYYADRRIDFRELVRDLFGACKARIWMKKVNEFDQFVPKQFAMMALQTGMHFSPSSPPAPAAHSQRQSQQWPQPQERMQPQQPPPQQWQQTHYYQQHEQQGQHWQQKESMQPPHQQQWQQPYQQQERQQQWQQSRGPGPY